MVKKKSKKDKQIIKLQKQFNEKFEEMAQNCMLEKLQMSSKLEQIEQRQQRREKREKRLKLALFLIVVLMAIIKGLTLESTLDIMLMLFGG